MQSWKDMSGGRKLAIVATAVAVLAIGGVAAADRFRAEPVAKKQTAAQAEPSKDPRPVAKPLELGTVAKISANYSVAVTELSLYEGEDAQFLAATIKAEYIGNDEGEPWADLAVEFADADGRTAAESTCAIDVGNESEGSSDQPALTEGDVRTYVVCIDLPSKQVKGGRVFVEEALAKGPRRSWSTDEVVTKEIPRAVPGAPGGRPATEFRPPSGGGSDSSEVCEEYEDDVEEYRDGIDELNEIAKRYKGNDEYEDELEEFEDWKDAMDANVERYEQVC